MKSTNIKTIFFLSFIITTTILNAQELVSPSKAIALALENNHGIKIADKNLEVAENNTSIYNSGYLPTLTGNAGATYNLDNIEAEFTNGQSTTLNNAESSRYNASVSLNYILFDGLGRKYNYQRLKEQYQLTELQARETIENTITQLFSIYYNVSQSTENVEALEETLAISKDRLTRSKYEYDYGQVTKLSVLNAEVDINNDSINLLTARQQLQSAKRDLNFVLGNAIDGDFNVDTNVTFIILLQKEELLEKAKDRNVLILQANKTLDIGALDIKTNRATYLPTLGLTGSYGWNKNNNNQASFVAVSTNTGLSGGLNLSWNIFDGGITKTRLQNAKINLENSQLQKEQTELSVLRDFNNAWDDYQNKLAIFKAQEINIITAQNNFENSKEKFKLGRVNSIEFRQAQLNLLNVEVNKNRAKYEAKLAELLLLQLSGELLEIEL